MRAGLVENRNATYPYGTVHVLRDGRLSESTKKRVKQTAPVPQSTKSKPEGEAPQENDTGQLCTMSTNRLTAAEKNIARFETGQARITVDGQEKNGLRRGA